MIDFSATREWRITHPGAMIGLLELENIELNVSSPQLDDKKRKTESALREQYKGYTRQDFLSNPVISAYSRYYRQFNKTYHVLQQVESIALKGKNLPDVSPLVDSNFIAEVNTLVLTAGHDANKLLGSVVIDIARVGDKLIQMNGALKEIPAGDMIMRDLHGVCCSIIYGQDNISPISHETSHVLYVAYAPAGVPVDQVNTQLHSIQENILMYSPFAVLEQQRIIFA